MTARQMEVLHLIAQGYTQKHAAAELRVSPKTIEAHLARIRLEVKADSLVALVHWAILNKVIVPGQCLGFPKTL